MARTQQEIFEESRGDDTCFINTSVPDIRHSVWTFSGEDTNCLEVSFENLQGDIETVVLSMDIVEDFSNDLMAYKKGLLEATALRGDYNV
jgi:hypothetical protein